MSNELTTNKMSNELMRHFKLALVRYGLILPIQAVLPLSVLAALRSLIAHEPTSRGRHTGVRWLLARVVRQFFRAWTTAELWFALFYFVRKRALSNRKPSPKPPQSSDERLALFERCLDVYQDRDIDPSALLTNSGSEADIARTASEQAIPALAAAKVKLGKRGMSFEHMIRLWNDESSDKNGSDAQSVATRSLVLKRASLSGWFLGADCSDICRGNAEQWVAWSFFLKEPHDLDETEQAEVDDLIDRVAKWADLRMNPGFNPAVTCIRVDFDPIPSAYRPLSYYACSAGLFPLVGDTLMRRFGFEKLWSGYLEYWHRPPLAPADGPAIVVCHGLGIGVLNHASMLSELCERAAHRRIIFVSLPHISQRPAENQASPREFVMSVSELLASHRCLPHGAHFVGHSFGTIVCGWILRFQPALACRLTLLDPVCFLLCKHDIAVSTAGFTPLHIVPSSMRSTLDCMWCRCHPHQCGSHRRIPSCTVQFPLQDPVELRRASDAVVHRQGALYRAYTDPLLLLAGQHPVARADTLPGNSRALER